MGERPRPDGSASRHHHASLGSRLLAKRYPTGSARAALYQRIRDRVRQVPGVMEAGVVTHLPLSGSTMMDGYEADLSKETSFGQVANYQGVTPGYFRTLRIPILQGRDFTDQEDRDTLPVIIVDESLVRTVFPRERSVIGKTLRIGWGLPNARIVGVVGHARTIDPARAWLPCSRLPPGCSRRLDSISSSRSWCTSDGVPWRFAPPSARPRRV